MFDVRRRPMIGDTSCRGPPGGAERAKYRAHAGPEGFVA